MKHLLLSGAALIVCVASATAAEPVPASPTDFTADFMIRDGKGIVNGRLTAPTMTNDYINPQPLGRIAKIVVTRSCWMIGESDVPVATFEQASPGRVYTFTDSSIGEFGYEYSYYAVAMNAEGNSAYGTSAYAFAGIRPQKPEIVSAVTTGHGQSPVTFTLRAEALTEDGETLPYPLTSLTLRYTADDDDETSDIVGVVENPESGKEYTLEFAAEEGMTYEFSLVSACQYGRSEATSMSMYIGIDSPGSVTDLVAASQDGGAKITWTAPSTGRHNGWIDPAATLYRIERRIGYNTILVAKDVADCEYFDPCEDLNGLTQLQYVITAYNEVGEGTSVYSNELIIGPTATLPFTEHFNKKTLYSVEAENLWSYDPSGWESNWSTSNAGYYSGGATGVRGDENNEEGYAYCSHSYAGADARDVMTSSPISIEGAEWPVLSFWYLARPNVANRMKAGYTDDNGNGSFNDFGISDKTSEDIPFEWRRVILPMSEATGTTATIYFEAYREAEGDCAALCIDEILVDNYPPIKDFMIDVAGDTATINWLAPTNSTETPTAYEVSFDDNNPVLTTELTASLKLTDNEQHSLRVKAIYEDIPSCWSESFIFDRTTTGLSGIAADGCHTEYYDLTGTRRSSFRPGEIAIIRSVGADGSVSHRKVVIR